MIMINHDYEYMTMAMATHLFGSKQCVRSVFSNSPSLFVFCRLLWPRPPQLPELVEMRRRQQPVVSRSPR